MARQSGLNRRTTRRESIMAQSQVYAAVAGSFARRNEDGLVGVFRRTAGNGAWEHVLELEAFAVGVHPRDANVVLAGTGDGVWRSTDRGATFERTDFPDRGVQIWSITPDPADPRLMFAGGSPLSVHRSEDGGEG